MATIEPFHIGQNDLLEELEVTLLDADGNPVDLSTGVTSVTFQMKKRGEANKVDDAAATAVNAAAGQYKYTWVAGDTDTAGEFRGKFQVTYTAGTKPLTFPNRGWIPIFVHAE